MTDIGRILIAVGLIFLAVGGGIFLLSKVPGLGKLPGDIIIKKENFTFYFPLATSILLSLILTLIFTIFQKR